MKRINIVNHPLSVSSIADIDSDGLTDNLALKAERWQARKHRQFKQQLS